MAKLYVGNLPYSVGDAELANLFSGYNGFVSATVIMDKMTRRSKGFGFVEIADETAEQAIAEMNNKDMEGRALVVNVAKPLEDRPRRDFNSSGPRRSFGGGDRRGGFGGGDRRGGGGSFGGGDRGGFRR